MKIIKQEREFYVVGAVSGLQNGFERDRRTIERKGPKKREKKRKKNKGTCKRVVERVFTGRGRNLLGHERARENEINDWVLHP